MDHHQPLNKTLRLQGSFEQMDSKGTDVFIQLEVREPYAHSVMVTVSPENETADIGTVFDVLQRFHREEITIDVTVDEHGDLHAKPTDFAAKEES